jgi:hypothetical protein
VPFVDELPFAVGWTEAEPAWMARAAHAVAAEGRVWVLDPFEHEAAEERVRDLGEPAGVVQLLDRHARDCAAWAYRLGVPHHVVPAAVPGAPFVVVPVVSLPGWREVALWFAPTRTLVVADALASADGYRAPGDRVAVHPLLRPLPPRRLAGLEPEHLLLGHGKGVHGSAASAAVAEALATARRRLPRFVAGALRRAAGR